MADGISPTSTATPDLLACTTTVHAPDGSEIHVPHTVTSFGDRISPSSDCAGDSPSASHGPAASIGNQPPKVIGTVHAVVHPASHALSPATTQTSHQTTSGDFVVRGDGSIDGAQTIERDRQAASRFGASLADPSTVQNHALKSLSLDPLQKSEGLVELGHDTIEAAPSIAQAAGTAARGGWDALRDYATASTDPSAAERTLNRGTSAVAGLYNATLAPAVNDSTSLGQTLAAAPGSASAAADVAVGVAGEAVQIGTLIAPEARAAKTAADVAVHVGVDEAEHVATATAEHAPSSVTRDGPNVESGATPDRAKKSSRNSGLPPELRANNDRYTRNAEKADPEVAQILAPSERRAHHLIPVATIKENRDLFDGAAKAGFRTDEVGNMMLLPANKAAQDKLRAHGFNGDTLRPIHDNGHGNEISRVGTSIGDIKDQLRRDNLAPGTDAYDKRACELLRELESTTRSDLQSRTRVTLNTSNEGGSLEA